MQNDDTQINKQGPDFKDDLTEAIKIHEKIKDLGFDRILKRLKDYGFSDPEILAREILENKPQDITQTKNNI